MANFDTVLQAQDRRPLVERIQDPATWDELFAPIERAPSDAVPLDPALVQQCHDTLRHQGHFVAPIELPVGPARAAVDAVEAAGFPAVFAFLSDAVWDVCAGAGLVGLIDGLLGPGARLQPGLWSKRVTHGDRGWEPHVDIQGPPVRAPDGMPAQITLWLSLTDVTLDNGCMYIVPEDVAPDMVRDFGRSDTLALEAVEQVLHNARALPAPAGSVLAWSTSTLHWGARHRATHGPDRMSLGLELRHPQAPPEVCSEPSWAIGHRPDFATRLRAVGHSLQWYGSNSAREPGLRPFVFLGRLLSR